MNSRSVFIILVLFVAQISVSDALEITRNGKPVAVIVVDGLAEPVQFNAAEFEKQNSQYRTPGGKIPDTWTAGILAHWLWKITGAELTFTSSPEPETPAIYVGQAAIKAGLKLDDIKSETNEGVRIVVKGNNALIAGQDDVSNCKAVCRFLEELGCRYLIDTSYMREGNKALGEIYPTNKTLTAEDVTITEKPKMVYRDLWGSSWFWRNLWKVWNGCGGTPMSAGHSWAGYLRASEYFDMHPEYFALRDGQRRKGEWLCTSNQEVRDIFVQKIFVQAEKFDGKCNLSISPPDDREYCRCEPCVAQDDPRQIVPSSGTVSVTRRYLEFYEHIAKRVQAKYPDVRLGFYCYADYTEPPLDKRKLPSNLVAWVAPIRYSRYHHIGNPISPSRMELKRVIEGWGEIASHMAYRTYNFNLAESTVPFAKFSTWNHDIPYLQSKGCLGVNIETFPAWSIMGPTIYHSAKILYDPDMDSDVVMEDYYTMLYGPKAAPLMKDYWNSIDQAFQNLRSESGCFFALHLVYTPEFRKKLQGLLDESLELTKGNELQHARVQFANKGMMMAHGYMEHREHLNKGEFAKADEIVMQMSQRSAGDQVAFHNKTNSYISRFLKYTTNAANRFTAAPNRLLQLLPDKWRMTYDPDLKGEGLGFHKPDFDDSKWQEVATYSATLNEQKVEEKFTYMWYRSTFEVPEKHGKLVILFCDVDGEPSLSPLFINGKNMKWESNRSKGGKWSLQRRKPIWSFITDAVKPGKNSVSLLLDHRNISENFLGGIVRPVALCEYNEPAEK